MSLGVGGRRKGGERSAEHLATLKAKVEAM